MKIGVEIKIDVTKIDKARLFAGKKGKYLSMTSFIDIDNKGPYDDNGMVTHKKREGEGKSPILGNVTVFWSDSNKPAPQNTPPPSQAPQAPPGLDGAEWDDDIPF